MKNIAKLVAFFSLLGALRLMISGLIGLGVAYGQQFIVTVPSPLCTASDAGTLDMSNGCTPPAGLL